MSEANAVNNHHRNEASASRTARPSGIAKGTELDSIFNTLGHERAQALLKQITPEISRRIQSLLKSISAQDWSEAAHTAHRLLSTASLFASEPLIQNLIAIETGDMDKLQQTHFANTLGDQLKDSMTLLETYQAH